MHCEIEDEGGGGGGGGGGWWLWWRRWWLWWREEEQGEEEEEEEVPSFFLCMCVYVEFLKALKESWGLVVGAAPPHSSSRRMRRGARGMVGVRGGVVERRR